MHAPFQGAEDPVARHFLDQVSGGRYKLPTRKVVREMLEEASKAVASEIDKALQKNGPWVLCSDGATTDNMGF
eukprot:8674452-Prorocentrum_lima.AAC.1